MTDKIDRSKFDVRQYGANALNVDMMYPDYDLTQTSVVNVGISCVRAADSLMIRFDFTRNGYSIMMERTYEADGYQGTFDPPIFDELAFVPAWNEVEPPEVKTK